MMGLYEEEIEQIKEHRSSDQSFCFYGRSFENKDVEVLSKLLSEHPYVTELDLGCNNIGDEGAAYLTVLAGLTVLKLSRNNITGEGLSSLLAMQSLKYLFLDFNALTNKNAQQVLSRPIQLCELKLAGNEISEELYNQVNKKAEEYQSSHSTNGCRR